MMLIEETPVPEAALPLVQFKAHLRLGSGFGEDSLQDEVLQSFLRAAIAAIEARTCKVLITRDFSWSLLQWRDPALQVLPVAPVVTVASITMIDAVGGEQALAVDQYRLEQDAQYPRIRPVGAMLPTVVSGGSVKILMTAGMTADWDGLPADLGQAVLLLAAHYYEYRDETTLGRGCMPFGVTSLIERYRVLRLAIGAVQ